MHNCLCDTMQDMQTWRVFTETVTSRHTVVCLRSRKQDTRHTSMLFIGIIKLPNSACCISKTTKLISTKFIYLLLYISKFSRKSFQHFSRYLFLKISQFPSHFSSLHKIINIFKLR